MNMASSISRLTIRDGQGQTKSAVPSVTVGVGSPIRSGQEPHVLSAAFSRSGAQFMGGRAGGSRKARRCSIGLPTSVPVAHPFGSGLAVHDRKWSINMANATPRGAIRPNSTVSRSTLEKRVRRALSAKGHYLQKTRPGSDARIELGEFAVLNDRFVPLSTHCKLPDLAKFLGVMTDQEAIEADHRWCFIGIDLVNGMAVKTRHYFEVKATTEPDQHDIDDLTGNDLDGQVEALLRLASDWRQVTGSDDKPLKFSRGNVRLMLDHLPHAGRAIAAVLKGGTKNADH